MQLFHLVAAWLFPCAVCATTTMTTPAAADDGEGGRAAEQPPIGDRLQLGTSSSRQQRSRSASPPCFGARTRRQTAAATNGEAVVANDEPTTAEHHPRKSGRRPAPARNAIATDSPAVSSASYSSPTSSPPSSLRDRLRLGLTASPPRRAHDGSGMSRSPEAEKGGAVGGYLRRISKRLMTTRGATAAADAAAPSVTMIPRSYPLVGEGRRKGGSAIATEDEIRAFVIANGSRAIPLV
uniref:Uncharacterized protein n=1 Tax=Oryza rufipogon TaxID=4529 RepID=A0A0E0QZJ7_ORYRU